MSDMRLSEDASHPAFVASTPCIKIDKGVPMPTKGRNVGRPSKYPWRRMEVGDSFVVDEDTGIDKRLSTMGRAVGFKFETRVVEENGKRAVRVWRTA